MEVFVRFLNQGLSFVAFLTAATLVLYMLVVIVTGTLDVANLMLDTLLLEPNDRQTVFNGLNSEFLHNVAVLLILMKAYRILIEYMRYHHIDLKYMVEIVVVACVLELLFNFTVYSEDMRIILGVLAVTFLAIYAFRYDTLVKALEDTKAAHTRMQTPVASPVAEPVVEKKPAARKPRKTTVRKKIAKTTTKKAS